MNKITIPICGDTIVYGIIVFFCFVVIGLVMIIQYIAIQNDRIEFIIPVVGGLLFVQFLLIHFMLIIVGVKDGINRLNPFQLKGDCGT